MNHADGCTGLVLKVALDARLLSSRNTGDTSYWRGLVTAMLRKPAEVNPLLFSNTPCPNSVPEDWRSHWVHVPAKSDRWWSLVAFPMSAKRHGCQVVHTQYNVSPLAINPVTTIHDVSFFIGPEWFKPRDRFLLQRFVPRSVARARKVLTVSETSKSEIEKFIPAAIGKTVVTPNALGSGVHLIEKHLAQQTVAEQLSITEPYALTIGTIWPRKNVALALAAVNLLPESVPLRLVLAGKAGWGDLPSCDRAIYPGFVSDEVLSALYSAADLYICPSLHEGFGIPLLEAFACGCPVVCSTGGALPEVAGEAAEVVPDFRPETWSATVQRLLADSGKLDWMREAGLRRVKDFDWATTADLTIAAYKDAANA